MKTEPWYNEDRVAHKGSTILTQWKAEREAIRALGENGTEIGLTPEQLYERLSGMDGNTHAGQHVTEEIAMRVSAVYGCVDLLAGVISSMPVNIFERKGANRVPVDHDYWWLLNEQANPEMTAAVVTSWLISSKCFNGDGFFEILRPTFLSKKVSGLLPHHPARVQPFRDMNTKRLYYRITPHDGGPQYVLDPADIIHLPSMGFDGLTSPSPITWSARQNIGIALAAEEYSAKFFRNGATSQIALKSEKKLDKEQIDLLRSSFMAKYSGSGNYHMPLVLSGGLSVETLSINPEDAALIATRQFSVEEICRVFHIPPHMIGHTTNTTSWGTGIEQLSLGFVKYALRPILNALQQELNRKLWPVDERYFVRYDTSEIERGDLKSQYEALRIGLGRAGEKPWFSQNDIRRKIGEPPIVGGDNYDPVAGKPADNRTEPA
ncbi:phage portal protein [Methylobacillus flagellatus]|uniref:phage portal protein n=1 Tax=Methylobacillus flagellatus TaxID=405 RepID=UPI0010F9A8A0|nr:phage portal protein [Methylobacillus flagellatus]